jgi:hypothetical protein
MGGLILVKAIGYNVAMNRLMFLMMVVVLVRGDEYVVGEGWQFGDSPIVLGGYLSSMYTHDHNPSLFSVDDVALLGYGEFDHFDFLTELEATNVVQNRPTAFSPNRTNSAFRIERMYGDYYGHEGDRLRWGKFNSDVGFWNQMAINVLRDTTANPRLATDFFPKLTTGIHYEQSNLSPSIARISWTLQHTDDLDNGNNNMNVDRHYAMAMDLPSGENVYRFSGGYFQYDEQKSPVWYATASLKTRVQWWDVLMESVGRYDVRLSQTYYDGYVQGVWHFNGQHSLILRSEVGKSPQVGHDESALIGYTYRPWKSVALKGEFEGHLVALRNRWLFSLSILF